MRLKSVIRSLPALYWKTSAPSPPVSVSLPKPPERRLATALPMSTSLPEPVMPFSMTVPGAKTRLPISPPALEACRSLLSLLDPRRSRRWLTVKFERSIVSVPPSSLIVKADFDKRLDMSANTALMSELMLVLAPQTVSPVKAA